MWRLALDCFHFTGGYTQALQINNRGQILIRGSSSGSYLLWQSDELVEVGSGVINPLLNENNQIAAYGCCSGPFLWEIHEPK